MTDIIQYEDVERRIIQLRGQKVLLDRDVAELYGVETKRINEAVRNNTDKFPYGYLFELDKYEKKELVENFVRFNSLKHSTVSPTAFTERGLYMLATILKSPIAVKVTIAIIDTFTQIREMVRKMETLQTTDNPEEQKKLLNQSGEMMANVIGNNLNTTATETEIELNFALVKIKHKVKRTKDNNKNHN
ncbi:MAG: ORF6N domain-containing protein [Bacteroidaceae bacterium]|nr:ORF6N domain-containing protein [Bacteroidaceae bacterium]